MTIQAIVAKLVIGAALAAAATFGADNSIGTWKRNIEKSKSNNPPPNPITSQTVVRESVEGGVKVTSTGQRKDGNAIKSSYTVKYDGKAVPVEGSASYDTLSLKQIDANTFATDTRKTGGKYHTSGRTLISNDGKTMTTRLKGTDSDGKPLSFTIVYDKQ